MDEIDDYEPSDEEIKELEEMVQREEEEDRKELGPKDEGGCDHCGKCGSFEKFVNKEPEHKKKSRLTFTYQTESHWAGWLKIHGIRW
jgi:hypothetical protein